MKKAQILSAIALAFALGVVAPVAGVVSGNTYAIESRAIESATKKDVTDAISKVENYGIYKNYAAVFDALDYYKTEKVLNLNNTTEVIEGNTAIAGLRSAISDAVTALGGTVSTTASLETAIATAKKTVTVASYNAYNALYTLVKADDKKTDLTALKNAITNIDGSTTTKNAIKDMAVEEVKDYVKNAWGLKTTYTNYVAMIDAVNNAETVLKFADRMETALNNVQSWKQTDGDTAVDTAADDATDPVKELVDLAVDGDGATTGIEGFTEYKALYDYVNGSAKNDSTNNESTTNKNIINQINSLLKVATVVNPGEELSLDDLKATDGTGDGTNKPDDEKDPSAPDTGILSNTEASASTTLAMVAGIATALTAAGAGVVAYRNARRANK